MAVDDGAADLAHRADGVTCPLGPGPQRIVPRLCSVRRGTFRSSRSSATIAPGARPGTIRVQPPVRDVACTPRNGVKWVGWDGSGTIRAQSAVPHPVSV